MGQVINKLEKGRAEFAYKCAKDITEKEEDIRKNYRSYVRGLPAMILTNGLGQALAFINAKKENPEKNQKNAYNYLYEHIEEYMKSGNTVKISVENGKNLVEWVISIDSQRYRWATEEILAFSNWLRRFAEALIPEES